MTGVDLETLNGEGSERRSKGAPTPPSWHLYGLPSQCSGGGGQGGGVEEVAAAVPPELPLGATRGRRGCGSSTKQSFRQMILFHVFQGLNWMLMPDVKLSWNITG